MRIDRHALQQRVHVPSPEYRLFQDISFAIERIFTKAGKDFLKAKTDIEIAAAKQEAETSIKRVVSFWKGTNGSEEVSRALNALSLSEFDT